MNRVSTKAIEGKTPFEAAFGVKRTEGGDKLGGRVVEGRWIGVDAQSKGARIYWPDSSVSRNEGEEDIPQVIVSQTDTLQTVPTPVPPSVPPADETAERLEGRAEGSLRRSARILERGLRPPTDLDRNHGEGDADLAEQFDGLGEAKRRADWPLWEQAIREELEMLKKTGTWELTERPPNVNVVGSKWVFRAKKDAAGNVVRYKARLVAQGFSQVPGVDYFDTFAPVARLAAIRSVLALAANLAGAHLYASAPWLCRTRLTAPSLSAEEDSLWA
jgi:hypothetical protein